MSGATAHRRPTFAPVVLVGVVAGALGAVAGSNAWYVEAESPAAGDPIPGVSLADPVAAAGEMPLALALNLAVLAVWGVVLVTRGGLRRAVAAIGMVAALAQVVVVVSGFLVLDGRVAEAARERIGASEAASTQLTGWFAVAAVAAVVSTGATLLATLWAPRWPEMGRRYDAPGTAAGEAPPAVPPQEQGHLDLWKSMDEGRDPTA